MNRDTVYILADCSRRTVRSKLHYQKGKKNVATVIKKYEIISFIE